ncbi:hypothetical protein B566_EDAN017647 [Ephemera danica]|nr:hypothetical protein B566_EDAN017647 [Ephemera danica]
MVCYELVASLVLLGMEFQVMVCYELVASLVLLGHWNTMAEVVIEQQERLQGAENYQTWKFAMKMRLIELDLWNTIEVENLDLESARNRRKNERALGKISLSVRPELYSIVNEYGVEKILEVTKLAHEWKFFAAENYCIELLRVLLDETNVCSILDLALSLFYLKLKEDCTNLNFNI